MVVLEEYICKDCHTPIIAVNAHVWTCPNDRCTNRIFSSNTSSTHTLPRWRQTQEFVCKKCGSSVFVDDAQEEDVANNRHWKCSNPDCNVESFNPSVHFTSKKE